MNNRKKMNNMICKFIDTTADTPLLNGSLHSR